MGDEGELIELFRALYQESNYLLLEADEFNLAAEDQARIIEKQIGSKTRVLFVAETNKRLVGFLGGTGGEVKRNRHSIYTAMGVLKAHQGKGVGRRLLRTFINWASENRYHRIELTVMESNSKALSLYQGMGFEIEGIKHHSLKVNGKYIDEHYMAKLI